MDAVDQYQCASCYSFPITATIEYLYSYKLGKHVKLSEQQLIDCVNEDDKINGCADGDMKKGFEYAKKIGLVSAEDYPYQSFSGNSFKCRKDIIENPNITKYKIDSFTELPKGNCSAIQEKLIQNYTVATMLNAENLGANKVG